MSMTATNQPTNQPTNQMKSGGGFQYGNPSFDTKQLFAQLTINPNLTAVTTSDVAAEAAVVAAKAASLASLRGIEFPDAAVISPESKEIILPGEDNNNSEVLGDYTKEELASLASMPLNAWFVQLAEKGWEVV